jgi:hypothetical protein
MCAHGSDVLIENRKGDAWGGVRDKLDIQNLHRDVHGPD